MNKTHQSSLLKIGGLFLVLQAVLITLSPAVRLRSWSVDYIWSQWVALAIWVGLVALVQREITKRLPDSDSYIFPVAALLSGWGVLTIWRIAPEMGVRQIIWFSISLLLLLAGLRIKSFEFLQRYKYLLLFSGLFITTFTLLFGINPNGYGPRLWLGCCDVYFQPSEPLKLLLIIFLAAYFSEKLPYRFTTLHILYPTIALGGIVLLLLLAQRDLGTACIFLALHAILAYFATNRKSIVIISLLGLVITGIAGYYLVDIVQIRIESWIYPWNDPQGGSYQIVQSLIAIANGGIEGRGPGLGSPGLIPVAVSDFIYASIAEETGLFGTLSLLAIIGILITRGMRIALRAPDLFKRFLASGISIYFGVQSILIIGGNIRLLPLTGVTLPFLSYGGSSLLTSFIALLILLLISNDVDDEPAPLENPHAYLAISLILLLGLFVSALVTGWWAVIRGPDLQSRTDNLRHIIEERYVPRGNIVDRSNSPITITAGEAGSLARNYLYPDLAPITGYNDPIYGRVGLESSLNDYLRGLEGIPASSIWLNHLLYGMSPPGLDVRLSIDLKLQTLADQLMRGRNGAVILMNAESGEILVIASHPTFDPNHLSENAADLLLDPQTPLFNRAALGYYPTGSVMEPFVQIQFGSTAINTEQRNTVYEAFGFNQPFELEMDTVLPEATTTTGELHTSPLHMAVAASAISNQGVIPAPRIAMAINTPKNGWVTLPAKGMPTEAIQLSAENETVLSLIKEGDNYWSHIGLAKEAKNSVTWFIGGTPPGWVSAPLAIVVLLEENNARAAEQIAKSLLSEATHP